MGTASGQLCLLSCTQHHSCAHLVQLVIVCQHSTLLHHHSSSTHHLHLKLRAETDGMSHSCLFCNVSIIGPVHLCSKLYCSCTQSILGNNIIWLQEPFSADTLTSGWVYSGTSLRWTPLGPTKIVHYRKGVLWSGGYYTLCGDSVSVRYRGMRVCPLRGVPLYIIMIAINFKNTLFELQKMLFNAKYSLFFLL